MYFFVAQALIARLEGEVGRHTSFYDELNQLTSWLRVAFEKSSTFRDASGDDVTIQSKLHRLAAMQASMAEGDVMLERTIRLQREILPNTPQSTHAKLESDVTNAQDDLQRLKDGLEEAGGVLEKQLARWKHFEAGRSEFESALSAQQLVEREEAEAVASAEEAEQQLTRNLNAHQHLDTLRQQLNDVTSRGQELLEVNSDARVTHALAQLTCSFQSLERALCERGRHLREACAELQRLERSLEEVEEWLETKRQVLLPTSHACDIDARSRPHLEAQLHNVRVRHLLQSYEAPCLLEKVLKFFCFH